LPRASTRVGTECAPVFGDEPSFQAVQKKFAAGPRAGRDAYCAGCHDPISLFAGAKDIHNLSLSAPGMQEGCSCVVCHAIDRVDQRGNPTTCWFLRSITLGDDLRLEEGRVGFPDPRLSPTASGDYDRAVMHTPEFCGVATSSTFRGTEPIRHRRRAEPVRRMAKQPLERGRSGSTSGVRGLPHAAGPDSTDPSRGEGGAVRAPATTGPSPSRNGRHELLHAQVLKLPTGNSR